jgi:hypothetical protein
VSRHGKSVTWNHFFRSSETEHLLLGLLREDSGLKKWFPDYANLEEGIRGPTSRSRLFLTSIEDVYKFPRVLVVFYRQFLGLLIDNELGSRKQYACALSFLIAQV